MNKWILLSTLTLVLLFPITVSAWTLSCSMAATTITTSGSNNMTFNYSGGTPPYKVTWYMDNDWRMKDYYSYNLNDTFGMVGYTEGYHVFFGYVSDATGSVQSCGPYQFIATTTGTLHDPSMLITFDPDNIIPVTSGYTSDHFYAVLSPISPDTQIPYGSLGPFSLDIMTYPLGVDFYYGLPKRSACSAYGSGGLSKWVCEFDGQSFAQYITDPITLNTSIVSKYLIVGEIRDASGNYVRSNGIEFTLSQSATGGSTQTYVNRDYSQIFTITQPNHIVTPEEFAMLNSNPRIDSPVNKRTFNMGQQADYSPFNLTLYALNASCYHWNYCSFDYDYNCSIPLCRYTNTQTTPNILHFYPRINENGGWYYGYKMSGDPLVDGMWCGIVGIDNTSNTDTVKYYNDGDYLIPPSKFNVLDCLSSGGVIPDAVYSGSSGSSGLAIPYDNNFEVINWTYNDTAYAWYSVVNGEVIYGYGNGTDSIYGNYIIGPTTTGIDEIGQDYAGILQKPVIIWTAIVLLIAAFAEYKIRSGGTVFLGISFIGLTILAYLGIYPSWVLIVEIVLAAIAAAWFIRSKVT